MTQNTKKVSIQTPTEWVEIKNQEPPSDVMLLVSGCPVDPKDGSMLDIDIVVSAFFSSRSKAYIRMDSGAECINEWMIPLMYHVVYNPDGNTIEVSSMGQVVPNIFED